MSTLPDELSDKLSDELIWASLPIPALILDSQNRIAEVNPAAEGFMMSSARALIKEPIWDRLAVDVALDDAFDRARTQNTPLFVNDAYVGTGDRPPTMCSLQLAPLSGANGSQEGAMILLISPHEMAGRFTQGQSVKSAAKSAIGMAEMLSHEIKNPLAGITGAAQLLSMGLGPEDLELTDLIVSESRRIVGILDQVEQFGNLAPPKLGLVNLHDILDRSRRSAMVGFAAHMKIIEDYDPSLPPALADADQLQQVVLNLLKNAAEAAGSEGGTITLHSFYEHSLRVRTGPSEGRALPLHIEVIDDGPGLPDEIAKDIFDPFVSGRENGTGLGLALAAKIMSDHGGWISVNSVPGRTVFRLSLPRGPNELAKDD